MDTLESISLSGFKSIRDLKDLRFKPLNVLIGANGVGKSNLISFFRMLNFAMTGALREYVARSGYADAILYFGAGQTQQLSGTLDFRTTQGLNCYGFRLAHAAGDTLIYTDEHVEFHRPGKATPRHVSLGVGHQESALSARTALDTTAVLVRNLLRSTKVYQFHDTSPESKLRGKWRIDDNRLLFDHGGNLASILYWLQQTKPDLYDLIVATISQGAPFFGGFVLEPDRLNPNVIDLRWKERGSRHEFGPHQISDGTLRFMALVTLLCLPQESLPKILLIDEPELGLHPAAINILADLMRTASASSQLLVSTQSVTLVNQFEVDNILVAEREDDQSTYRWLDANRLTSWLEDYALGELWEKNLLGGRP